MDCPGMAMDGEWRAPIVPVPEHAVDGLEDAAFDARQRLRIGALREYDDPCIRANPWVGRRGI
jgi:hypothetical protein